MASMAHTGKISASAIWVDLGPTMATGPSYPFTARDNSTFKRKVYYRIILINAAITLNIITK